MTRAHLALFDTPIGRCGIAWRGERIVALQLPEASAEATATRLARRAAADAAPPGPMARRAIDALQAHLAGRLQTFADLALDLDASSTFERRVYAATAAIAAGTTLEYAELAARIGEPGAARAVGGALGRNPVPLLVPCHRVLAAGGGYGGFSASGGPALKRRLLEIEGALAAQLVMPLDG